MKQKNVITECLRFFSCTRLDQITYGYLLAMLAVLPFAKAGVEVCLTIAISTWLMRKILERDFFLRKVPFKNIFLLYILICAISVLNSEYLIASLKGMRRALKFFLLYCVVSETITTRKRIDKALKVLIVVSILSCWDGLYQYWTGWNFRHSRDFLIDYQISRISASFNHPNNFSAFLLFMIPLTLLFGMSDKMKRLAFVTVFLQSILLFYTGSRASIYMITLFFLAVSFFQEKLRTFALGTILLITYAAAIIFSSDELHYYEKFVSIFVFHERFFYWRMAVNMVGKNLLFGLGINTFMSNFSSYSETFPLGLSSAYAHSVIMQNLAETGFVGLACYLALITQIFRSVFRSLNFMDPVTKQTVLALLVATIMLFAHACLDTDLQTLQLSTLFWFSAGAIAGLSYRTVTEKGV